VLLAAAACGCSPYYAGSTYEPKPADVDLRAPDRPTANARTLVSVIGLRKKDESAGLPPSVELRIRLENDGATAITFDPSSLELLAANLESFPAAAVAPAGRVQVAPGDAATVTAYFPFPDGKVPGPYDLSGLSLRWQADVDGEMVSANATFHRKRDRRYYDQGPYYPFGYPGSWWYGTPYHHGRPHKPKVLKQQTPPGGG